MHEFYYNCYIMPHAFYPALSIARSLDRSHRTRNVMRCSTLCRAYRYVSEFVRARARMGNVLLDSSASHRERMYILPKLLHSMHDLWPQQYFWIIQFWFWIRFPFFYLFDILFHSLHREFSIRVSCWLTHAWVVIGGVRECVFIESIACSWCLFFFFHPFRRI